MHAGASTTQDIASLPTRCMLLIPGVTLQSRRKSLAVDFTRLILPILPMIPYLDLFLPLTDFDPNATIIYQRK